MPVVILAGIGWHILGAAMAASFYAPIGKVRNWSWETTWAIAGLFSWILLPIGVSLFLLPDFIGFYASMGSPLLLKVALFGAMWGVGNVSYGLTMRHLGMSLGIGVAIGVTLVVGTLVPPLAAWPGRHAVHHAQRPVDDGRQSSWPLIGVAIVSYAGHQKEVQLGARGQGVQCQARTSARHYVRNLLVRHVASRIDAARPMEAAARLLGVNSLYAALPSYVIIMGGGAVVNLSYCFIRLAALKRLSLRADLGQPRPTLIRNALWPQPAASCGTCSSSSTHGAQPTFPQRLSYVNWMLHMSIYVLCGGLVGLALGEWKGVASRPVRLLWAGVLVIIAAANLVGLGMAS